MTFDPGIHHRRSIRLRGYNYSQSGAYFVTICAQNRACLFGDIVDEEMRLNDAGQMIWRWYRELEQKFSDIQCGDFICMPNHIHFIVANVSGEGVGADLCVCPDGNANPNSGRHTGLPLQDDADALKGEHTGSPLPKIVQWFKTMTTNAYIEGVKHHNWSPFYKRLWQRNYYEHVVRNDVDLERIQQYIENNPRLWQQDTLHPQQEERHD